MRKLTLLVVLIAGACATFLQPQAQAGYAVAPGAAGYGYGPRGVGACNCNSPCSCAPTLGSTYGTPGTTVVAPGIAGGSYSTSTGQLAGWTPGRRTLFTGPRGYGYGSGSIPRPPSVVAGDSGSLYQNLGSNGGAYLTGPSIGGGRVVIGGFRPIPIGRPRVNAYGGPIPIGGGSRLSYLGRSGPDGYIQAPSTITTPTDSYAGPMTTVKIVLPDGTTKSISIPEKYLSNTVEDTYVEEPKKYVGPVATDPFGPVDSSKYIVPTPVSEPTKPYVQPYTQPASSLVKQPEINTEVYRPEVGKDDPATNDKKITNLYRALLTQDIPASQDATSVKAITDGEIERILDERREQVPLPDGTGKFDRPNLEDYIVLRKDDPRAVYLRDRLIELENQAQVIEGPRTTLSTAAPLLGDQSIVDVTEAPFSRDPAPFSRAPTTPVLISSEPAPFTSGPTTFSGAPATFTRVGTPFTRAPSTAVLLTSPVLRTQAPFSRDSAPGFFQGTIAELPQPIKKEDMIGDMLEHQELLQQTQKEHIQLLQERLKQAQEEQRQTEQQLQSQQQFEQQQQQQTFETGNTQIVNEQPEQFTRDELPPVVETTTPVTFTDFQNRVDPRAHFNREHIDVRRPRPPFKGQLIDDARLSDFRPLQPSEVLPSSISQETKAADEFRT